MTAALQLPKGFDAADALAMGFTAANILNHLRTVSRYEQPKPITPTFPNFGVPVAQADEPLRLAIDRYFSAVRNHDAVQHGIITGVASGKTEQAIRAIIQAVNDGMSGVLFVPQHALSVDLANRINSQAAQTICRVWFGIERDDPTALGQTMCRIVEDAIRWQKGGGDLQALCKECPHRTICGYQAQRADKTPSVWILPSNMAETAKPSNIPPPAFVIFDEAPTQALLAGLDSDYIVTPTELLEERTFPPRKGDTRLELSAVMRDILIGTRQAMAASNVGPFKREVWAGINIERIRDMAKLEWTLAHPLPKPDHAILGTESFKTLCENAAKDIAVITKRWRFWKLLADLLESGQEYSPNLIATNAQNILMAWKNQIHDDWGKAPTLLMDATLNESITKQWFPRLEVTARTRLEAPFVTRTQVTNIPFAARQWNPNPDATNYATQKGNADRLAHFLEVKAAEFRGQGADGIDILFVGQKRLVEYLREVHGARLGERVRLEWQNNLRGVDTYKGVRCLILTGRLLPGPSVLERRAGVIFGELPEAIQPDEKGMVWYPDVEEPNKHLRMKDGTTCPVKNPVHPDPNVQAIMEQICHAELLQCEGRARANRRTAENPLNVIICTNVCLDLTIDQAVDHKTLLDQGAGFQLLKARGIIPEQWTETALILGHPTADSVKKWFARHLEESAMLSAFLATASSGHLPIATLIGECPELVGWNRYSVRRDGSRQKAWVWVRGDHPELTVKTFLGDAYTLLSNTVPMTTPLRSAPTLPAPGAPIPANDPLPDEPAHDPIDAANDPDIDLEKWAPWLDDSIFELPVVMHRIYASHTAIWQAVPT